MRPWGKRFARTALLAAVAAALDAQKPAAPPAACTSYTAAEAARNQQEQARHKDEILAASRLLEKDPAGFHLFQTPHGKWWIPAGDDYVLPFNLAEQARDIYGSGEQAVRPGDVVLDCGANVGVFSRAALDRGAKLVVAFEPAPENIEAYRRNFAAEIAARRVILVPKGVWDKEDVLVLRRDPNNSAADSFVLLKDGSKGVQAPLTTIDRTLAELKIGRVDFIKMDVEGAEVKAIAGARGVIGRSHPRLSIAGEHLDTDAVRIPQAVRGIWAGYKVTCGPAVRAGDGQIRPDVLYFH
jgi:FkbM family methyltransferase